MRDKLMDKLGDVGKGRWSAMVSIWVEETRGLCFKRVAMYNMK